MPAGEIRHLDHDSPTGHEQHECGSSAELDWTTDLKEHEMSAIQLTIADIEPTANASTLTAADLDEWIALVEASTYGTGWWPNEWARNGLALLLGEPFPHGRWLAKDLLTILRRAHAVA